MFYLIKHVTSLGNFFHCLYLKNSFATESNVYFYIILNLIQLIFIKFNTNPSRLILVHKPNKASNLPSVHQLSPL